MPVDNLEVVDVISIDLNGNAVLTISDQLEWDINNEHLLILQNKINYYLEIIESGLLYEKYPKAKKRNIIISLVALYSPNQNGKNFIERVKKIIENYGYGFKFSCESE